MPSRRKGVRTVVVYGETGYVIHDFGENESPRFGLYNSSTKKYLIKSDCPLEFDEKVGELLEWKRWKKL